ncbi:synembryn-B [Hippocampus zosterae]|uniref:synembryn-B n=1 Tax=Hippocampus zosterae TaxID=109293 RepID=UPI00223DF628|nr:synembryn-B [Hippocampus zosterae]XP_051917539.1 synembryn-B [Hippocampus zosterae]XP_051917540.1 synembryn-B [Hippocampus zosterae]
MDLENVLSQLESANEVDIEELLKEFNRENSHTFTFDQKEETLRSKLCQSVLIVLGMQVQPSCQKTCLETLRILSRDKCVLAPVATRDGMLTLARMAQLGTGDTACDGQEPPQPSAPVAEEERVVVVEALKCLCNVVYNSAAAQQVSVDVKLAHGLCASLHTAAAWHHEVGLFTLRLLFLLSALRSDLRVELRRERQVVKLLAEVLEHTLDVRWDGTYEAARPDPQALPLPKEDNERAMEALKALFNLTVCNAGAKEDEHQYRVIAAILRHVLMLRTETEEKTEEAHSHAVNLLNNLPVSCLDVLIDLPIRGGLEEYGGKNMDAIQVLLDFMEKRIDKGSNYKEGLTPVLSLLSEGSRHHREIRRYIKAQVLPPLTDVKIRPEVGTTTRNKLVRLMTHVEMAVKQAAAEFLFVLCKESVDNLLKYTGYGNAAGLLMARGLLGGGRGETEYSPDEDSDTEEYKTAKPFINPITGHVEEPMPNPMEEMTEEQKEYEAQKLVNMLDKLSRQSLIRPMGVKPDGTLAPLEETLHAPPGDDAESDSD